MPMMQALAWMTSINWLEIIKTLAPVATAIIAFAALRNWQRQDKAKREAEFLDALIEAAHAYIADLPAPITTLEMAKIGMVSHAPTWERGEESDIAIKGAIAFIEKDGERVGKRLLEALENTRSSVIKLRSLAVKGQVFNFSDYTKCQNAVAMLTWHFDRMEGVAAYISSPTWNWENAGVRESLKGIMSIDASEMRTGVQDSHLALLEFARVTYKRIYR
jgi:hypothetical protein